MSFWSYKHLIYGSTDFSEANKIQVIGKLQNLNSKYYGSIKHNVSQNQKLVVKSCPCCSSKLKIFYDIEKYRCGYCKINVILKSDGANHYVTNNLVVSSKPKSIFFNKLKKKLSSSVNFEPYILSTLANLHKFEADYDKSDNKIEVMNNFINSNFNLTSMAKSFTVDKFVDFIDYKLLAKYYYEIFSSSNKMYKKLKYKMILRFYDIVSNVNVQDTMCSNNHLRAILIILECPFFKNNIFSNKVQSKAYKEIQMIAYKILTRCICFIANCSQEKKSYLKKLWLNLGNEEMMQKYLEFVNVLINHIFSKTIQNSKTPKSSGFSYFFGSAHIKENSNSTIINAKNTQFEIKVESYKNNLFLLSFFKFSQFLFNVNEQKEFISDKTLFYSVYIDYIDLEKDFVQKEIYKNNDSEYCYFFVTNFSHTIPLGCKFKFLEARFRDTMKFKAEEAFLKAINKRTIENLYFHINVKRISVLQDTINQINNQLEIYKTLKCLKEGKNIDFYIQKNYLNNTFLNNVEMTMHKSLRISFVGEPGLDGSGLKREWFQKLILELFDTQKNAYFKILETRKFWFKEDISNKYLKTQASIDLYFIIGVIIGLSIYNCISSYVPLPATFYKKLLNVPLTIRDFREVYPQEYLYLTKVNNMSEEELEQMDLRFEVTIILNEINSNKKVFKNLAVKNVEIIPNGSKIKVTAKNKLEFIKSYMNYYLSSSVEIAFKRLQKGFKLIINETPFYELIKHYELYQYYNDGLLDFKHDLSKDYDARYDLIKESDIRLLSHVTKYMNEGKSNYNKWNEEESDTIKWFWELVIEKTEEDRLKKKYEDSFFYKLMLFTTGNGALPVCGLHVLELKISKMKNPINSNATLYPIAHTCFNELCVYEKYRSKQLLYESILVSISHDNTAYGFR